MDLVKIQFLLTFGVMQSFFILIFKKKIFLKGASVLAWEVKEYSLFK